MASSSGASSRLLYDPFAQEIQDDPYPIYERLLADYPAFYNADRDFWAISRFSNVQEVARDWRRFSSAQGVRVDDLLELAGPSFITMDPVRHDVLRKLVRGPFEAREVAALESLIEAKTRALLTEVDTSVDVDMAAEFAKRLPVLVICHLLGLPEADAPILKSWGDQLLESSTAPGAARMAAASLAEYWRNELEQRRRTPGTDILSLIVQSDGNPRLLPEEEIGICNLLFEAGNSTTTSLIGSALLYLARYPEQREWLRSNEHALPAAIEELLRFDAPVQNQTRVTTEDVDVAGSLVPRGSTVMLLLGAANRDPRVWPEPGRLWFGRAKRRNLAFGEGIHHCIGAPLARLEARIAVRVLLTDMATYEVTHVERFHDVTLRMIRRLIVRFDR
jgi:cytochrome P450